MEGRQTQPVICRIFRVLKKIYGVIVGNCSRHDKPPVAVTVVSTCAFIVARVNTFHEPGSLHWFLVVPSETRACWIARVNSVNFGSSCCDFYASVDHQPCTEAEPEQNGVFGVPDGQHFLRQNCGNSVKVRSQVEIPTRWEIWVVHEKDAVETKSQELFDHWFDPRSFFKLFAKPMDDEGVIVVRDTSSCPNVIVIERWFSIGVSEKQHFTFLHKFVDHVEEDFPNGWLTRKKTLWTTRNLRKILNFLRLKRQAAIQAPNSSARLSSFSLFVTDLNWKSKCQHLLKFELFIQFSGTTMPVIKVW